MTQIVNEVFAPPLGFQTNGGPGWKTTIVPLASGREVRNGRWARPLRRWTVTGVPISADVRDAIVRFFNARSGAFEGFLFRDPFANQTAPGVTATDQQIGVGDGAMRVFQLVSDDGAATLRSITRPLAASVRLAVDGVETTDFTLDDTTGVVTLGSAPASGLVVTAGFEFFTPVRFDHDVLEISQTSNGAFQLVRLSLIELRETGDV